MKRIGICLSRGGLTGIYGHIGFLEALHELGIKPRCVLGTSAGSIVGSIYATNPLERLEELVYVDHTKLLDTVPLRTILYRVFRNGRGLTGLVQGKKFLAFMQKMLGKDNFAATKIPLYVHATDITNQREHIFSEGSISDKVVASSAIPFLIEPVEIDGVVYVDGGVTNSAPEELAKKHELDVILVMSFIEKKDANNDWKNSEWTILEVFKRIHNALYFEINYLKVTEASSTKIFWISIDPINNISWTKHDSVKKKEVVDEVRLRVLDILSKQEVKEAI